MWESIIKNLDLVEVVEGTTISEGDTIFESYDRGMNDGAFWESLHSYTWDEASGEPGVKYYLMRKPVELVAPDKYPEGTIVLGRPYPADKITSFIRTTDPMFGALIWKSLDNSNHYKSSIILDEVLYVPEEENNG